MKAFAFAFGALFITAAFAACGDSVDDGGPVDCTIGDPVEGSTCECSGAECVCPSSGDCAILCVDTCGLQCAGSGNCEFECFDDCDVACTGSGDCIANVGNGSHLDCPGSGDCHMICAGDCTMDCPGSGLCTAECSIDTGEGQGCTINGCPATNEPCLLADIEACDGSCPAL